MPLYKITEKRLKKRALEDELGLTEIKAKMREMGEDVESSEDGFGFDSDESSDDDDDEDKDDDEDQDQEEGHEDESEDQDDDDDNSDDGSASETEPEHKRKRSSSTASLSSDRSYSPFPLTPQEALTEPIYTHSTGPRLCVFCPGKILKNDRMVEVHLSSVAHKRAMKRYTIHITSFPPSPSTDPRRIADTLHPSAPSVAISTPSKIPSTTKTTKTTKTKTKEERLGRKMEAKVAAAVGLATGTGTGEGGVMEGLNRKERRLLAKKVAVAGGAEAVTKANSGPTPTPTTEATGPTTEKNANVKEKGKKIKGSRGESRAVKRTKTKSA